MSSSTNFSETMAYTQQEQRPWLQASDASQTIGINIKEATQAINDFWFCKEMQAEQNSFESNVFLALSIKDLQDCGPFLIGRGTPLSGSIKTRIAASNATHVTFELLRRNNPHWKTILDSLIKEELNTCHANWKGSHSGFYSFVFSDICKTVLARSVLELWARPILERTLKSYSQKWIENRFAPGGIGYFETATHFELQAALQAYALHGGEVAPRH